MSCADTGLWPTILEKTIPCLANPEHDENCFVNVAVDEHDIVEMHTSASSRAMYWKQTSAKLGVTNRVRSKKSTANNCVSHFPSLMPGISRFTCKVFPTCACKCLMANTVIVGLLAEEKHFFLFCPSLGCGMDDKYSRWLNRFGMLGSWFAC